ncbi:hypothetical protein BU24DRAFT_488821 [Aaosphaeria arxii CBS 175.79]|uniref:Rhodopsin domain-containing protein n=1 Tax=Aaosphaeria arxii CBS 175.79 TaxID=1450172 RepID=A0A6A5XZM3_9PLEO|nr:uncharacterized protein BU24DRAFT_488821 [Aaosphaeria arxii CBS 175.79]KAF2018748.1 hypothetical protein BU24DRAFT_488821 [Aaosphaeria arxii CBS 175.79]
MEAALPPPPGLVPNFSHPPRSLGYGIRAYAAFSAALCSVLISIRLFTRIIILRKLEIDDYTCIFSWVFLVALTVLCQFTVINGAGLHQWNMSIEQFKDLLIYVYVAKVLYLFVLLPIKITIILQLRRFFAPHSYLASYKVLTWLLIISTALAISSLLTDVFQCHPIRKAWEFDIPGKCITSPVVHSYTASVNMATDFAILLLPAYWIWKLKIAVTKRIQISLLFVGGIVACLGSILHLYEARQMVKKADQSYMAGRLFLWCLLEVVGGFISSCLPVHPIFFRAIRAGSIKAVRHDPSSGAFRRNTEEDLIGQSGASSRDPTDSKVRYPDPDAISLHYLQEEDQFRR